jgi:hypothetical protein
MADEVNESSEKGHNPTALRYIRPLLQSWLIIADYAV